MFSRLRKKLSYISYDSLFYSKEMKKAYSSYSVTGMGLKGKTVLITGATGDIGIALAERFLKEGCNLILAGRKKSMLQELKANLFLEKDDVWIKCYDFDLSSYESIDIAIDLIEDPIDVLICNAGFCDSMDRLGIFRKYDSKTFDISWKTNFKGNAYIAKLMAKRMNDNGTIIFVSSICAQQLKCKYTPYGMSKTAIWKYAEELQRVYESLNVGVVLPGSVATKMVGIKENDNICRSVNKLNRVVIPEEISALVAFMTFHGRYLKGIGITASACEIF